MAYMASETCTCIQFLSSNVAYKFSYTVSFYMTEQEFFRGCLDLFGITCIKSFTIAIITWIIHIVMFVLHVPF